MCTRELAKPNFIYERLTVKNSSNFSPFVPITKPTGQKAEYENEIFDEYVKFGAIP